MKTATASLTRATSYRSSLTTPCTSGDINIFVDLGLVPCQVQDGKLVNLLGPGAQPRR